MPPSNTHKMTRQEWLGLLAKADPAHLAQLWGAYTESGAGIPQHDWIRDPQTGGVMVRGRLGGVGAPFNLGEMTVTRASARLKTGEMGHGYVQGRRATHAKTAALIDALMQTPQAATLEAEILTPLAAHAKAAKAALSEKAATTKVDFFTMVRGE